MLLAGREGLAQRTINVPGDAATIQAGIDAANAGDTVAFIDGAATLSRSSITAAVLTASFATESLAVDVHTISAVYLGDATHDVSASAPVSITIVAAGTPDFSLASSRPRYRSRGWPNHLHRDGAAWAFRGYARLLKWQPARVHHPDSEAGTGSALPGRRRHGVLVSRHERCGCRPGREAEQKGRRTGILSLAAFSPICLLLLAVSRTRRWRSKLLGMAVAMMLASSMGCGSKFYTGELAASP